MLNFTESIGFILCSTFGQNLEPSTGTILETGFVACVGIFGLILFIYLIGNVQVIHSDPISLILFFLSILITFFLLQ